MPIKVYQTLAHLAEDEGTEIGVSGWLDITQEQVNQFAEATGDHQWIHTDPERTRRELDMPTIAHGYLTLALIPCITAEILTIESVKRIINFGSNKVRYTGIVPVGSRLRGRIFLLKAVLSSHSLRTISTVTMEREGERKPVLIAEVITIFYE